MAIEVLQARRICPKGSLIECIRMECEFDTYEDFALFASRAREVERAGGGDLDFSYRDTSVKHNTQTEL